MYISVVYIMRGQPVHNAHIATITKGLTFSDNVVILLGSSFRPRSLRNPFTFEERKAMLYNSLAEYRIPLHKVQIEPIRDYPYNDDLWINSVRATVDRVVGTNSNIAIIGHKKDGTSIYLNWFKDWKFIEMPEVEPLNATDIRQLYFQRSNFNPNFFTGIVPKNVVKFLSDFNTTQAFTNLREEHGFIEAYKQQYASLPYPPIFTTADALVVQSGHVLLIQRADNPGKNLWALPGGYVNANSDKSIKHAMLRELKEETNIHLQDIILERNIVNTKVFDSIDRDPRGRVITHTFYIKLNNNEELPKVKSGSDAKLVKWVPLNEITQQNMFLDHWDQISDLTGAL